MPESSEVILNHKNANVWKLHLICNTASKLRDYTLKLLLELFEP